MMMRTEFMLIGYLSSLGRRGALQCALNVRAAAPELASLSAHSPAHSQRITRELAARHTTIGNVYVYSQF